MLYEKEMKICPAYIPKYKSTIEKQIILLMVLNLEKKGCDYLAVKRLSALLHD